MIHMDHRMIHSSSASSACYFLHPILSLPSLQAPGPLQPRRRAKGLWFQRHATQLIDEAATLWHKKLVKMCMLSDLCMYCDLFDEIL